MMKDLAKLQEKITRCKKCPRLVEYLAGIRKKFPTYWCKPVPSFGDHNAQIVLVGLAPGRYGSNRTARMFTGDASGEFLYDTLYDVGLCNQPKAVNLQDGLVLKNCYITAVGRCAPPQNKPTPQELENCFPYFADELKLLKKTRVIVALGKIAFDGYLKYCSAQGAEFKKKDYHFSHGAIYDNEHLSHVLIASYHPSRQNTQTGRLTKKMFKRIFLKALEYSR